MAFLLSCTTDFRASKSANVGDGERENRLVDCVALGGGGIEAPGVGGGIADDDDDDACALSILSVSD